MVQAAIPAALAKGAKIEIVNKKIRQIASLDFMLPTILYTGTFNMLCQPAVNYDPLLCTLMCSERGRNRIPGIETKWPAEH